MVEIEKIRCPAMIKEGIVDPESKEGITFCTESCPYEDGCIIFDKKRGLSRERLGVKIAFARNLRKHHVSVEDISLILRCDKRTVQRYLTR